MNGVLGGILPLAIAVAISPVPVMAAILMLLSPRARITSVSLLVGWVLSLAIAFVIFTLLSELIPEHDGNKGSQPVIATIKLVVGILLLGLAVRQWRQRPAPGTEPKLPKWMAAIDSMKAGQALVLGMVFGAVNPKNLMMVITAAVDVGTSGLSVGFTTIAIVVFVVLASTTIAIPVVGYLVAKEKMQGPLEGLRVWLTANNNGVMSILFLLIGVVNIGRGIAAY